MGKKVIIAILLGFVMLAGFSVTLADEDYPDIPTGLRAEPHNGYVDLYWNANAESNIEKYIIYRAIVRGGIIYEEFGVLAAETDYRDERTENDTIYYYVITARNIDGNESPYSNDVWATPSGSSDHTPPNPPTNLRFERQYGEVIISWNPPTTNSDGTVLTDLSGYMIHRTTTPPGTIPRRFVFLRAVTSPTRATVSVGESSTFRYYYSITAYDNDLNMSVDSENLFVPGLLEEEFVEEGGTCFIATAACGTSMAKDVVILCQFRDRFLMTNGAGRIIVGFYEFVSPPLASIISRNEILRGLVRLILKPIVAFCQFSVSAKNYYYFLVGIISIIGLVLLKELLYKKVV